VGGGGWGNVSLPGRSLKGLDTVTGKVAEATSKRIEKHYLGLGNGNRQQPCQSGKPERGRGRVGVCQRHGVLGKEKADDALSEENRGSTDWGGGGGEKTKVGGEG